MMYTTYRLGTWMLGVPNVVHEVPASFEVLFEKIATVWQPLLLGSFVTGLTLGLLAFTLVRLYWRWKVAKNWSLRKRRKGSPGI